MVLNLTAASCRVKVSLLILIFAIQFAIQNALQDYIIYYIFQSLSLHFD